MAIVRWIGGLLALVLPAGAAAQVPRFEETPHVGLSGLRDLDATRRRAAAAQLGKFKADEKVRTSLQGALLQDPDLQTRQAAAKTLAKLGAKTRAALTQAAVCDPDASMRKGLEAWGKRTKVTCHTLPDLPDQAAPLPRAEEQLLAFLGHPSPATRAAAMRDLAKLRSDRGQTAIWTMASRDPVWAIRASAIRILARSYGNRLLPALQHALAQDPDARVRVVALEALAFLKAPPSVPWVTNSARLETIDLVQRAAVKTLGALAARSPSALATLAELSESHRSEEVRAAAVEALAALGRSKAVSAALAKALKQDRSGKVRAAALRALSSDNSAAACSARAERMNDPDAEVRRTVVEQLSRCPASIARPALTEVLREDKDAGVRRAAAEILAKAGAAKSREVLLWALANDKELAVRKLCLGAALALPKKDAAAALADAAKNDSDAAIRRAAATGLRGAPTEIVVPALTVVLLRDRAAEVRLEAARVLAVYRDPAAYQALQQAAAKDASPEVRKVATAGAAKSPAQKAYVDALLPQLIDDDMSKRLKAVGQLCSLQIVRTYRALLLALWTDRNASVRTATARCFAELDHPLVDLGLSIAHSTDQDGGLIRQVELSQKQRVERLQKLLERAKSKEAKERADAAAGLQPSPSKNVREVLERLLAKDPDPTVRKHAATTIARYLDKAALQRLMSASQTDGDASARQHVTALYNALRARWSTARTALNINTLIQSLKAGALEQRVAAAQALGTLRDRRAFAPLQEALAAAEPALRQAAVVALATFGDMTVVAKAARTEKDAAAREALIQLNFLRNAAAEKVIAALSSAKSSEVRRGVEAASIKQLNSAVPWLVRTALSHIDTETRVAAVRALALYDQPVARWAIRVASEHDASPKAREQIWLWAVQVDSSAE